MGFVDFHTTLRPYLSNLPQERYAAFHQDMPEFNHVLLREKVPSLIYLSLTHSTAKEVKIWLDNLKS